MTCLSCQRCESGPMVTLHDGRVVCNYCPDWKDECEATHILAMPSIEDRRRYLALVSGRRGQAAGLALGDLVKKVWAARRRTK